MGGEHHAQGPLPLQERDPVSNVRKAGRAPGPVCKTAENLAPTGIRSPDRPARSQSLYIILHYYSILCHTIPYILDYNYVLFITLTT